VTVRLFAKAREIADRSQWKVSVPAGTTSQSLIDNYQLLKEFPLLRDLIGSCAIAVKLTYVAEPVQLKDGDELAVIPPISGG